MWLAEAQPGPDWESGAYYEKRKEPRYIKMSQALDPKLAHDLWERSEHLLELASRSSRVE